MATLVIVEPDHGPRGYPAFSIVTTAVQCGGEAHLMLGRALPQLAAPGRPSADLPAAD